MTVIDQPLLAVPASMTTDLYRDVHKGIRAELFATTSTAGQLDPADRTGRAALAGRVRNLATMLVGHAEHEDGTIQPVLEAQLPLLAEQIETDHVAIEDRLEPLQDLADFAVDACPSEQRLVVHHLYRELALFSSIYLAHQDVEERVVMPALERAIGPDEVMVLHRALLAKIPPEEMAGWLALMLPAMNIDDRMGVLGGIQADAPAEVFAGVLGLAGTVLSPPDFEALSVRLGVA